MTSPVRELRLAVTVENYDDAVRFYRDVLGLPVIQEWAEPAGSGAILDAGHATLELLDERRFGNGVVYLRYRTRT